MTLEILISCMHQKDASLVSRSGIYGSAVMVNQCDREGRETLVQPGGGRVRIIHTTQRGLTRSRNMAIRESQADICMLCDDDEVFVPDHEKKILEAYEENPQADVIIFKMVNRPTPFPDRAFRLRFPKTMKVSSWQISFRRQRLLEKGVSFDELLGAGTGNGAEEELKFLLDCQRKGLEIWYVPVALASVAQTESTWFSGFNELFFENRGATTRYILGLPLAAVYGVYYVLAKRDLYRKDITPWGAFRAICRGMAENKITKQAKTN